MRSWKKLVTLEDWWAVWIGFLVLGAAFLGAVSAVPKIPRWETLAEVLAAVPGVPLLLLMIGLGGLSVLAVGAIQRQAGRFAAGFPVLFLPGPAQFPRCRESQPGGLRPELCPVGASDRTGLEQSAGSSLHG